MDADGYAYPFSALMLDESSRWELEIDDAYAGKTRTTDRSRISRWQQMKFGCTHSEIGTPETAFRIYRNGALVYETDVVLGEGLQNQELGFIEASNRLTFAWLFRPR